jgi:hypothetical protein
MIFIRERELQPQAQMKLTKCKQSKVQQSGVKMFKTIVRRTGTASLETLKESRVTQVEGSPNELCSLIRKWALIHLKPGDYMVESPANLAADYVIFNLMEEGETHPKWEDVKNLFYLIAYNENGNVVTID